MKHVHLRKTLIAAALASAAVLGFGGSALAQMGGSGMGPGMMGGAAAEQRSDSTSPPRTDAERAPRSGYGPGYGMGPGMMGHMMEHMMGGYGMGPGMMGGYGPGYGMGPGMMGGYGPGYGMGPGMMGHMMGGYGMGPGMMGGGYRMLYQLNLSPEQWSKVNATQQALAKTNWELAGKMREEAFKLHELATAEKRDRTAITGQYKKIQDLRLQRFQAGLDAQDKVEGVLTQEQRQQYRRFGSW